MSELAKSLTLPETQRVRVLNCLHFANIETLDQLCAVSADDLLKRKNFGYKSLQSIVEALDRLGRKLVPSAREKQIVKRSITRNAHDLMAAVKAMLVAAERDFDSGITRAEPKEFKDARLLVEQIEKGSLT